MPIRLSKLRNPLHLVEDHAPSSFTEIVKIRIFKMRPNLNCNLNLLLNFKGVYLDWFGPRRWQSFSKFLETVSAIWKKNVRLNKSVLIWNFISSSFHISRVEREKNKSWARKCQRQYAVSLMCFVLEHFKVKYKTQMKGWKSNRKINIGVSQ